MNQVQQNAFFYEIKHWNNIPIGSQNCGVGCIFCKVNGDPALKRYPALPAITLTDLYEGFKFLDPAYRFVRLGAGVLVAPHTDPFIHPDIYTFIQQTASHFPNKMVTTVTTGSYIETSRLDDLWKIENYGIDLSLITMQPIRETIIRNATREKLEIILRNAPIRKISLMFTGDIDDLKRDIEHLLSLELHVKCEQILVRRIEYTQFSPKKLINLSRESILGYEKAVNFLKKEYPLIEYTVPYLERVYDTPVIEYFSEAENRLSKVIDLVTENPKTPHHIMTPESSFSYFQNRLSEYPNALIHRVRNFTYSGSVCVAGLLTNQDLFIVLDQLTPLEGKVVVPYEIYDSDSCDLLGNNLNEVAVRYSVEVIKL